MRNEIIKAIQKQAFRPGVLGLLFNPFYLARRELYLNIKSLAPNIVGQVLDVGCGSKPYEGLFSADAYIGLEIHRDHINPKADVVYDGNSFPFSDSSYDCVVCNQVLEHVFNPTHFLSEISRVTKDGGLLLLTVPFIWDEHEQPYDFARYSSFGLHHLLKEAGFVIKDHRRTLSNVGVIAQLFNAYIYKCLNSRKTAWNMLYSICICCPVSIAGLIFAKLLPHNNDLFLDHIVLAEKKA